MFIKKKKQKKPQHMRISCLLFPPFPYLSEAMLVLDVSYDCGLACMIITKHTQKGRSSTIQLCFIFYI